MIHTPGPWRAEKYCIWAPGGKYVAGTSTGIEKEEQAANAALIAAAPELLAACQKMLDEMENYIRDVGDDGEPETAAMLAQVKAAIARAEERTA